MSIYILFSSVRVRSAEEVTVRARESIKPVHFMFVEKHAAGGYVSVKVFAGATAETMVCTGGLVLKRAEWEALRALVSVGDEVVVEVEG